MTPALDAGLPSPLGVTVVPGGVNVAVHSAHATHIEFCVFDAEGRRELARHRLPARSGDVHHGVVPGITAGTRYALRADGPRDREAGHWFDPDTLLLDPYARALDAAFSADRVPKAVVAARPAPHPSVVSGTRPRTPWSRSIIYELHVRGFTKRHPDIPEPLRGTFAGLAHEAAIAHLQQLGVTAVELMPVAAAIDEPHLTRLGLRNYWGYNTVGWMVPDPRLAPGGIEEVRACVSALHRAGIEVILDVVLNHSGEGDANGPTLSLRGLDNATYYRELPGRPWRYVNDTGTGNTLALDRPPVLQLALDTLRYWAEVAGVDGFRYDLATTLGRRADGFDPHAPLLDAITRDPILAPLKHIAEPWDIGPGGYRLGGFPAAWGEWNDRFRDTVRRFWRGDGEHLGELATRIAGSPDVFRESARAPHCSVNFVTAHDGFTLADLVSYEHKHNEANGEENRDGTNSNFSWNHGHEGATEDRRIRAARRRDQRALLATLLCARGTPMLLMGDELGRTQRGNNNAYAQDGPLTWVDWANADWHLASFVAALTRLRLAHPALHAAEWLTGEPCPGCPGADVEWRRPDGTPMSFEDWSSGGVRTLVAALTARAPDGSLDRVVVVLHGGTYDVPLRLPVPRDGLRWHLVVDTARPLSVALTPEPVPHGVLTVSAGSVLVLVEVPRVREAAPLAPESPADEHPSAPLPPPRAVPFPRAAGVLLHPTSLPGPHGIGDLGADAHRFLDVMLEAGLRVWQMLPVGPTGFGDSPYQCFSAFAGNPLLVRVDGDDEPWPEDRVDFPRVIAHRQRLLRDATAGMPPSDAYAEFCQREAWWLEDYALFTALKEAHGGAAWTSWSPGAARRDPAELDRWRSQLAADIEHHRRVQFLFFEQFHALKRAATARGITLMGDLPIYVAHDSADVWANPALFRLGPDGEVTAQAGVPPDYFSATGQRWGNPIYDWEAMRARGYDWWIRRMRAALALFDTVRIDHFRGFEAYWEIPGGDRTAERGQWVAGPGAPFFTALSDALGPLPIVAENLGVITPEVERLRERFGYPGMSILQFAFNPDGQPNQFQPHTYPRELVVYTGTHDNDTTLGWWNEQAGQGTTRSAEEITQSREFALRYLGGDGREMHWTLIRAALASVANTALVPIQDFLGRGSEARMNLPGRAGGNWTYRFSWPEVTPALIQRVRALVDLYGR